MIERIREWASNNKSTAYISSVIILALCINYGITAFDNKVNEEDAFYSELIRAAVSDVGENYLDEKITKEYLYNAALTGIFNELDQYSGYYTPEELAAREASLNNDYVGIGVAFEIIDEKVYFKEIMSGEPAEKAGLRMKDQLISINGEPIDKSDMNSWFERIGGREGESLKLGYERDGKSKEVEFSRGYVDYFTVREEFLQNKKVPLSQEVDEKTMYVQLSSFGDDTDERMNQLVEKGVNAGKKYLIVDLRNNGGGRVDTVINMLRKIVPAGKLVTFVNRQGDEEIYESELENPPFFVVVLVNNHSASASEVFSSAIQDAKVGVIVGEKTFGKGIAQVGKEFGDYGYSYTFQEYFSRNMNKVHEVGITPDYIVPMVEWIVLRKNRETDELQYSVKSLEKDLQYFGFFTNEPDEIFDETTKKALLDFQKAEHMKATGILDQDTAYRLNIKVAEIVYDQDEALETAIEIVEGKIKSNI